MATKNPPNDSIDSLTHLDAMLLEAMETACRDGYSPEETADILRRHAELIEDSHYSEYQLAVRSD